MLRFLVLGPLEARQDDRELEIGGGHQRALLALLLVHRDEVVAGERIVEELWRGRAPATATKLVQGYVSRLRRELGPDAISTHGSGYAVHPADTDAMDFERLVHKAQEPACKPREAARMLRDALALWRGPPFADSTYEPWAQAEIRRLEELRLGAIEELLSARLKLGEAAELVPELDALTREHPLRERLWSQLMLALYRSDRQAEALEAYRHARRHLVDELGIEPTRRLRELEQAILRQDPALDAVEDTRVGESTRRSFVGRERELADLLAGLDDAYAGSGRLFLVQGEPGIGKSRLAEEVIVRAQARGARVLVGRCWEAGGAPPFWPWVQSLRQLAREADPVELRSHLGAAAADLAQLLPDLQVQFPELAEPPQAESDAARFRLFEAVSHFLRVSANARPIVIVLDDMHAADEPSLLLLQFVARELAESRLLLLAAYRDVDPRMSEPLVVALTELTRERHTHRIALKGMSTSEVRSYIELVADEEPADDVLAAIDVEAEGNPFFVGEIVRLLLSEGGIHQARPGLVVPESVREATARRLRHLSRACNELLVKASVLGRVFGVGELAQLAGLSRARVIDLLEEAVAERVLIDAPGSSDRVAFAHVLIRDTLYFELSAARRSDLHRRAGDALETVHAADPETHLAELAHHFLAGAASGSADKAVEYARRTGDHAARVFAFEEALRLYESALESARDDSTRAHLLERMAQVSQMQGRLQEARVSLEEAVALHRTRGDKLAVGRVLTALSNVLWRIGDLKQVEMLADALAVLETEPPGPELVVAYSELAGHRAGEAAYAAAIEAADRALDLATELSLPEPARALGYRGEARASLGGREGIDDMRRALVLAAEQGQDRAAAVLHNNVAEALWIYDGPQAALEACRDGVEFCRDRGIDEWVRFIASTRLPLLVWCGRPAQALAEAEPLAEQADAAGDLTVLTEARSIQIHLAAQRGTGSEQLEAVELLLAHAPRRDHLYVVGVAAAAQLLVSLNRIEPAGALLAELEQVADLHDEPRYVATLPDVVRCALAIGDRDLAARFVIGVHARMPLFAHALCSASASLAEADTDLERAADLYAEAAERWRAFGNVPELAHALLGRGRCVLALERADADKPLTEAAELFKTLGYELPLATVDALLAYGAIGS